MDPVSISSHLHVKTDSKLGQVGSRWVKRADPWRCGGHRSDVLIETHFLPL